MDKLKFLHKSTRSILRFLIGLTNGLANQLSRYFPIAEFSLEKMTNSLPNDKLFYLKTEILCKIGRKLWENQKMLVTSILSFSHNVFKRVSVLGSLTVGIVW